MANEMPLFSFFLTVRKSSFAEASVTKRAVSGKEHKSVARQLE